MVVADRAIHFQHFEYLGIHLGEHRNVALAADRIDRIADLGAVDERRRGLRVLRLVVILGADGETQWTPGQLRHLALRLDTGYVQRTGGMK